jgi:TPR repeat protein
VERIFQSIKKSIGWFKRSANNGNSSACVAVGTNYEKETRVEQDYKEAISWYMKSKEIGGEIEALYCIGSLYYGGKGVK